MRIETKYFEKSIIDATKWDVILLGLNDIRKYNIEALKIIVSENDFNEIKEIKINGLKTVFTGSDKNYFAINEIGVCFSENMQDDNLIIVTEASFIIEDKFSEVISKINKL